MYCEDMMLGLLDGLERSPYGTEDRYEFEKRISAIAGGGGLDERALDEAAEEEVVEREVDLREAAEAFFAERATEEETERLSA